MLPGKYCAFFRFVYGDNLRFGQKVWCDILVQPEEVSMISARSGATSSNQGSNTHAKEEKSSLLNENEASEMMNSMNKPLQFENLADQYDMLQRNVVEQPIVQVDEKEQLKKTIN